MLILDFLFSESLLFSGVPVMPHPFSGMQFYQHPFLRAFCYPADQPAQVPIRKHARQYLAGPVHASNVRTNTVPLIAPLRKLAGLRGNTNQPSNGTPSRSR